MSIKDIVRAVRHIFRSTIRGVADRDLGTSYTELGRGIGLLRVTGGAPPRGGSATAACRASASTRRWCRASRAWASTWSRSAWCHPDALLRRPSPGDDGGVQITGSRQPGRGQRLQDQRAASRASSAPTSSACAISSRPRASPPTPRGGPGPDREGRRPRRVRRRHQGARTIADPSIRFVVDAGTARGPPRSP